MSQWAAEGWSWDECNHRWCQEEAEDRGSSLGCLPKPVEARKTEPV